MLWKAHVIHSPEYMEMAVMMLSPTYADIFHWGRMVPMISPIRPRSDRAKPRICRPELAMASLQEGVGKRRDGENPPAEESAQQI